MSDDRGSEPPRRRAVGDEHERRLLAAAIEEQPAAELRETVSRAVLAASRAERRRTMIRGAALGAAALAAAAVLVLYRSQQPKPLAVRAETPTREVASASAPQPSASGSIDEALAPCASPIIAAGKEPLIDDFEDGDSRVPTLEHRAGNWYVFNDGSGSQLPKGGSLVVPKRLPFGTPGNQFALFTSGGKFNKWGAVMSYEFSPRRCYDASAYAGVEFSARGRGKLWVNLKMTQVVPEEFGGSCKQACYDSHQKLISLSPQFQTFRIRWEELTQGGFGSSLPFDPHSLYSIEFSVHPEQTPFGYWIDDLRFIPRH